MQDEQQEVKSTPVAIAGTACHSADPEAQPIFVPEGEEPPPGYRPVDDIVDEAFRDTIKHQQTELRKLTGSVISVSAAEAKALAVELVAADPIKMAQLTAALSWMVINQSDVVDRIGMAVQDSLVFMGQHQGQLNTRNYAVLENPGPLVNLRMDYKGRTGDLTRDDQTYSYSYQLVAAANEEELKAGPDAFTKVVGLPRTTHFQLTHQLINLGAPMEPRTYYVVYSVADQDPSLAAARAFEGINPAPNKDVKGELRTNIDV